jgi:hypothetical protein
MTFNHYANLYLKFKKNELKNSTFEKYESIISNMLGYKDSSTTLKKYALY